MEEMGVVWKIVSIFQDKRVLEICSNTMRSYLTLPNCILKIDEVTNFFHK